MIPKVYCRPHALTAKSGATRWARPLAGSSRYFDHCELTLLCKTRGRQKDILPLGEIERWISDLDYGNTGLAAKLEQILERATAPRAAFAGLHLDRPAVMGIVNVTPDSFSDGGDRFDAGRAVEDGLEMWEAGAAILDVGGESTRPGADPVSEREEIARVVPVVQGLSEAGARVSIDTRHAAVMRAAIEAGAAVVNDVTALNGDPDSLSVVAQAGVPVVLMHMRGDPRSMQKNPRYDNVALEVFDYLEQRLRTCVEAGIPRENIALDVGIGFGKNARHNLQLLDGLALFHTLGVPILLGLSRKSFIAKLSRGEAPKDRLAGSLAGVAAGLARGVQIFRVHDVPQTLQMISLWQAIEESH